MKGLKELMEKGNGNGVKVTLATKISQNTSDRIDAIADAHSDKRIYKREIIEGLLIDGLDAYDAAQKTEKAAKKGSAVAAAAA